jgi:hypothetical protein
MTNPYWIGIDFQYGARPWSSSKIMEFARAMNLAILFCVAYV